MTHTKPCKFCGLPVTVESDPECPPEWAQSLLNMLACNRCADYRAAMGRIGAEIRKVCLNMIQMINGRVSTPEKEAKIRKAVENMTWKVAEATCKFYRVKNVIYDQDFVDQIMEHPDKSSKILSTYAGMVRQEARNQRQQHEQGINSETILHGNSPAPGHQAELGIQPDDKGKMAAAKDDTLEPARGAGENQGGGIPEAAQETVLI